MVKSCNWNLLIIKYNNIIIYSFYSFINWIATDKCFIWPGENTAIKASLTWNSLTKGSSFAQLKKKSLLIIVLLFYTENKRLFQNVGVSCLVITKFVEVVIIYIKHS